MNEAEYLMKNNARKVLPTAVDNMLSTAVDNNLRDLHNSSYDTKAEILPKQKDRNLW